MLAASSILAADGSTQPCVFSLHIPGAKHICYYDSHELRSPVQYEKLITAVPVVTLDTAVYESRREVANRSARLPARLRTTRRQKSTWYSIAVFSTTTRYGTFWAILILCTLLVLGPSSAPVLFSGF